ncbi:hypothetical protein ACFQVA_38170 [Actinomadura keratinilytica]
MEQRKNGVGRGTGRGLDAPRPPRTRMIRKFVAPDPGLARLRSAARAVLGIGLAATVSGTAGQSLTMAVAAGSPPSSPCSPSPTRPCAARSSPPPCCPPPASPSSRWRSCSTTGRSRATSPSSPWSASACTPAGGARAATPWASSPS